MPSINKNCHQNHFLGSLEIIDIQKALKRDYIINIENSDLEIGISGVLLRILLYFEAPRCSRQTGSFYALRINPLKYNNPKAITQSSWYIYNK